MGPPKELVIKDYTFMYCKYTFSVCCFVQLNYSQQVINLAWKKTSKQQQ